MAQVNQLKKIDGIDVNQQGVSSGSRTSEYDQLQKTDIFSYERSQNNTSKPSEECEQEVDTDSWFAKLAKGCSISGKNKDSATALGQNSLNVSNQVNAVAEDTQAEAGSAVKSLEANNQAIDGLENENKNEAALIQFNKIELDDAEQRSEEAQAKIDELEEDSSENNPFGGTYSLTLASETDAPQEEPQGNDGETTLLSSETTGNSTSSSSADTSSENSSSLADAKKELAEAQKDASSASNNIKTSEARITNNTSRTNSYRGQNQQTHVSFANTQNRANAKITEGQNSAQGDLQTEQTITTVNTSIDTVGQAGSAIGQALASYDKTEKVGNALDNAGKGASGGAQTSEAVNQGAQGNTEAAISNAGGALGNVASSTTSVNKTKKET